MQTNETNTPGRVRVVVAYEDYDADKRAHHACQQILQAVQRDKDLSPAFWKFDMLKLRAMRDAAAEEAAGADLLVLAPGGSNLPVGVLEWVESSLQHPRCLKALLVLLAPDSEDIETTPKAAHRLKALAGQLRVPFWCLQLETPSRAWSEPNYVLKELERVAQAVFAPGLASSMFSPSACTENRTDS